MSKVYLMDGESKTVNMTRIHCSSEDKELQHLLEQNLELLLGDQINPERPCQWVLIKREMPVTDPSTGLQRWAIDFFLADQDGIPTLVECKRCDDSRARREIVGQMFEYAANGHHYWTADQMMAYAQVANGTEAALRTKLGELRPEAEGTVSDFFKLVEQNLRSAKLRLIFFLEESPLELRSMVEFLSRQLQDTEIFLVEARQYQGQSAATRVVVPWLFGFTETVRVAARKSAENASGSSGPLQGVEQFWLAAEALGQSQALDLRAFVNDASKIDNCRISWYVSCVVMFPEIFPKRGAFGIRRSGELEMYFGYWKEDKYTDMTERQVNVRKEFTTKVEEALSLTFMDTQRRSFPRVPAGQWLARASQFLEVLQWMGLQQLD